MQVHGISVEQMVIWNIAPLHLSFPFGIPIDILYIKQRANVVNWINADLNLRCLSITFP